MARTLFLEGRRNLKKDFSIDGIARELKHRNSFVKNYFANSLPELVVPTQIIIGKDERTNKNYLRDSAPPW